MLTVACVLWRPETGYCDFDADYVAKLKSMVERHLPLEHRFVCFSNVDVPCERVQLRRDWPGWWAKMEVFSPEVEGRILLFDLDTVIVDGLSDMARVCDFTMIHGFYGTRKPLGSGVMMLPEADRAAIWAEWVKRPDGWMKDYRGDQEFLYPRAHHAKTWQELLPRQLVSYKYDCKLNNDTLPKWARVVCFHGQPRPHHLPEGHWIRDHWR